VTTIADPQTVVTLGVDTHADVHVAAVLDPRGRLVGVEAFSTTSAGHARMVRWARGFGQLERAGVEGTGAWGAGLARHLATAGIEVVEVDRPDRSDRHRRGKTDAFDAEAAARAVQSGRATTTPKTRTGQVESIRALRVARCSAVKDRAAAINRVKSLVSTAPDQLRSQLRDLTAPDLIATCAAFRPGPPTTALDGTKRALRSLARRVSHLSDEIDDLDDHLGALVVAAAPPGLLERCGVGIDVAGQLLVTAGDNPDRLHSAAAFAMLCGVAPIPVSSGKSSTHRLNRGGDRSANAAVHRIALCRMRWDPRTQAYIAKKMTEGKTKRSAIRCLKHHISREIYKDLRPLDHP
jgi:transposase